jgi:hypothetical protein
MTGLRKPFEIEEIVVHCADTPNGYARYTIEDIDEWHADRGWCRPSSASSGGIWPHVGYHYVIQTDGKVEAGRGLDEIGSHALGHNIKSIGVCLVGQTSFTIDQWKSLRNLIHVLRNMLPQQLRVLGHRDIARKTCPGFDVSSWFYETAHDPLEGHVCKERKK